MWIAIPFLASQAVFLSLPLCLDLSWWGYLLALLLLDLLLVQLSLAFKGCLRQQPMWLLEWVRQRIGHFQVMPDGRPSHPDNCVFAVHPHHVYGLGFMLNFIKPFDRGALLKSFYGELPIPLIADTVFLIRFLGEYLRMSGCEPIDLETMKTHLSSGHSVALIPGGTSEMALNRHHSSAGKNRLTLIRRKKFLEIAYELNRPAVPVLVLGEENCYRHWQWPPRDSCLSSLKHWLDYPFPLMSVGLLGTLLPLDRTPVMSVFGESQLPVDYKSSEEFITAYYRELDRMAFESDYTLVYINPA